MRGQETRALQTTYLNPEVLHETIREKDHSTTFPSTSRSLRSPGLPLAGARLALLCTSPSAAWPLTLPRLLRAWPPRAGQRVLGKPDPMEVRGSCWGKGQPAPSVPWLAQPALPAVSNARVFIFCTLQTRFQAS